MRPLLTQECKNVSGSFIGFMLAAAELDLITCIPICIIGVAVVALDLYAPLVAIAIAAPGAP